jgi:integrase
VHELQREATTETADILRGPNPVAAVQARKRQFIRIRRFRRRTVVVGEVLERIERIEKNPWVIVGTKSGVRLSDLQPFWQRVRARAGLKDVRIHDLRHSFASTALAAGQGLPMIGKLLGHTQVQTTARYAHLAADPVKSAAEEVSASIAAALNKAA